MKKIVAIMFVVCMFFCMTLLSTSAVFAKVSPKLSHGSPEAVGMDKEKLDEIDNLVKEAITNGITPGAVVLVAKDNKIVKESAYGYAFKYDMGQLLEHPRKWLGRKRNCDEISIYNRRGPDTKSR